MSEVKFDPSISTLDFISSYEKEAILEYNDTYFMYKFHSKLKNGNADLYGYYDRRLKSVIFIIGGNRHVAYMPLNGYFVAKHIDREDCVILEEYYGSIIAVELILLLLYKRSYNVLRLSHILPTYVKLFFTHIKDIYILKQQYNISEISQFMEDILVLRHSPNIENLTAKQFINEYGNLDYLICIFRRVLLYISKHLHEEEINNVQDLVKIINESMEMNNKSTDKRAKKYTDIVSYILDIERLVGFLEPYLYHPVDISIYTKRYVNSKIREKNICEYFYSNKINNFTHVFSNEPFFSHFLVAYSGSEKHFYYPQYEEFIRNEFYDHMLNILPILDEKIQTMLKANLAILMQNA